MNQFRALWRGCLKECPRCGQGGLFSRWTTMVAACPRCGLVFEHEEGYWVGAMTINIIVTELLFVVLLAVALLLTWPDVPTWPLVGIGVVVNALVPIIFYPFSKTIWVAVDLAFMHPQFLRMDDERL